MGAVDYFLELEGVDGESKDSKLKGKIEIESWSWGESNATSVGYGGGQGTGKVSMQDFHFVKRFDRASPTLILKCADGTHIPKAVLTCRKAGTEQQTYLEITFTKVYVSSYQTGGSGAGGIYPTDQISLSYEEIEVNYQEQDDKGNVGKPVKTGWKLKENVKK